MSGTGEKGQEGPCQEKVSKGKVMGKQGWTENSLVWVVNRNQESGGRESMKEV